MPGTSSSLIALKVLSTVSSVLLRVSPFPDYYGVYKRRDIGEVALFPVVSLFVNCSVVVMYACVIEDYVPLLATNALGVVTAIGFIAIFYICTKNRAYVWKMCVLGLLITAIVLVYTLLASTGVTHESNHEEEIVLGWIVVVTSIVMFGSPLATIAKVIRTRSNASLPLLFCIMNFVNGALWTGYAALNWNPFVLAPSIAGAVFGVMQVTLWMVYRAPATPQQGSPKISGESSRSTEAIVEGVQDLEQDEVFVAVSTPQALNTHQ